ncbi:Ivy1 protein [Saccharomycopsis crataegensis]|uniref:Ivy1 protein n=1 Tax=Saccharomycopsis crataegensis TaxID=43959 RepID=A0AAV5QNM3_9ASCO|nr:Ivy1 protein [Saccharomycopsis crataegensis]
MSSSPTHSQGAGANDTHTRKSSISFRAPHLSEFYKFVSGSSHQRNNSLDGQKSITSRPDSSVNFPYGKQASARSLDKRRLSTSTIGTDISLTPSILDLPTIISSKDRVEYEEALNSLHTASQKYSNALSTVSSAASEFGMALENLARLKGSDSQSNNLMACSGLFFLISNHQQVLSSAIDKNFKSPVGSVIKCFKKRTVRNDVIFNEQLKSQVRSLKNLESVSYKISKSKKRNLVTYKETLKRINSQIDSIDSLKYNYYDSLSKLIQDSNDRIIRDCCTVAKAEFEIHENIARKGWTGGGMDELLVDCPDPFGEETETESMIEEDDDDDNNGLRSTELYNNTKNLRIDDLGSSSMLSSPQPHAIPSPNPNENPFYTKISSKNPRVKQQLINTRDAITIHNDMFSPISMSAASQNLISPLSHKSFGSELGSRHNSNDNRSTHTLTEYKKITNEDNKDDTPLDSGGSFEPSVANHNSVKETVGSEYEVANHDDNNYDDEDGDDNSFSLPLPSSHISNSHSSSDILPNQSLLNNAWDD